MVARPSLEVGAGDLDRDEKEEEEEEEADKDSSDTSDYTSSPSSRSPNMSGVCAEIW